MKTNELKPISVEKHIYIKKENVDAALSNRKYIETIAGRKLTDFEYDFLVKSIKAKMENKKLLVFYGRYNKKRALNNDLKKIKGVFSEDVFLDEIINKEEICQAKKV